MDRGDLSLRQIFAESPVAFVTLGAALIALFLSRLGILPADVKVDAVFALVCLLGVIEVVDRRRQLSRIHASVRDSYEAIERRIGVQVPLRYDSGATAHEYLASRLQQAREIWHASVGPAYSSKRPPYKAKFDKALETALEDSNLNYRYVTTISSPEKQARIESLLSNASIQHAFVGTYDSSPGFPPTIYFIVVDNEVLVRCPHDYGEKDEYFLFGDPAIVEMFRKYHTILWHGCSRMNSRTQPIEDPATTSAGDPALKPSS